MRNNKLLIGILGLIGILVVTDILTGIFFWNRLNLYFDSANFNNVLTPIIGIISLVVYSIALFLSFRQNDIILSQHLRLHIEKEIDKLIDKLKSKKIDLNYLTVSSNEYNGIDFPDLISELLVQLARDNDYNEDYNDYKKGKIFDRQYFNERSYYGIVMFLSEYTFGLHNRFEYDYVKELIEEINESKLILSDKKQLKQIIKKEILINYISFIRFEDKARNWVPPIPILFDIGMNAKIEFKNMSDTSFRDHYDWFSQEFD